MLRTTQGQHVPGPDEVHLQRALDALDQLVVIE
jgi:hypothetical protein